VIEQKVKVPQNREKVSNGNGTERRRRRRNLLNMISCDVVGIVSCHHGLHLHQVLLHFFLYLSFSLSLQIQTKMRDSEEEQRTEHRATLPAYCRLYNRQ
jgi:hypothetical protein